MATLLTSDGNTVQDSTGSQVNDATLVKIITFGGKTINTFGGKTISSFAGISASSVTSHSRLAAPTISLSTSTLTMSGVSGATFKVYSNNSLLTSTTSTSVDLSTLITVDGTYTIKVIQSKTNYIDSLFSSAVTYIKSSSYTITPTLTNVTADSSNPTTIKAGESVTLTFTADEGYTLPETVSVTGATATWKTWMVYDVVGTSTNCYFDEALTNTSYTGTCDDDGTLEINIYADGTTYAVPTTLTVTGGTYSKQSNSWAILTIANPTEDISFTATGLTTTAAPENVSADGTTLTFDPVDGATSYEVYATDSEGNETDLGEYTPA